MTERNAEFYARNVEVDIEYITPKKAEHYLEYMAENRGLSENTVDKYARDILSGRWVLTSQGIGFDTNGRLIDGQHRAAAIVRAKTPIYTVVVRGLDPKAMRATDDNRKRAFRDDLKIGGRERYSEVAAATRMISCLERGREKNLRLSSANRILIGRIELQDELTRLDEAGDVAAACKAVDSLVRPLKVPTSGASTAYYLGVKVYGEPFTAAFFESLFEGLGLQSGDPALALRRRFERMRDDRPKPDPSIYAGCILKAMLMESRGETLTLFKTASMGGAPMRSLLPKSNGKANRRE